MMERTFVGLDVHARSVWAGVLCGVTGEVVRRSVPVDAGRLAEWAAQLPGPIAVAYEAGPTGFALARELERRGVRCVVAAPSQIPQASGDRVKTDRRDAVRLARLLRMGELVAVRVPTVEEEAARDLVRAREDARGDLMRARHRLSKLLLRRGLVWQATAWTQAHHTWLVGQSFEQRALRVAYEESYAAMLAARTRRDLLDQAIAVEATDQRWASVVGRLACLRGVSTLTAFGLAVEIGEWERFTGRSIGAYLGLVPSEASSGQRRRQGAITKTGNTHARRLLVEAAWHHRRPLRGTGRELAARRAGQPQPVVARADHAARRLHRRWRSFDERGKRPTVSAVAVARELAGWCWSLAVMDT
jgi:transposase